MVYTGHFGDPLYFGQADPGTTPSAGPNNPAPPPMPKDLFGIPYEVLGAHAMEGSQRGFTARLVDPQIINWQNSQSPIPQNKWKTGDDLMQENPDLGLNLDRNQRYSPQAESFIIQSTQDSLSRQDIIHGEDGRHQLPSWLPVVGGQSAMNVVGGSLLGGFMDPVFSVPSLLTGGVTAVGERAAAAGLLGETAANVGLKNTAQLGLESTLGKTAGEALTRPLAGAWGSRFVGGAATNASLGAGAYLVGSHDSKLAGYQDLSAQEVWTTVLGGAAVGGILHTTLGFLGDKLKLNTDNPAIQAKANEAANIYTQAKMAGVDISPEQASARAMEPLMQPLGDLIDKIENQPPAVGEGLAPDEMQPAPPGSEIPVEPAANTAPTPDVDALAHSVADDPAAQIVMTPDEQAILKSTTPEDLGNLAGEQIKRLRDTVVQFGETVSDMLDKNGAIVKDDATYQSLKRRAQGAITSMTRQLGSDIPEETSNLLQHLKEMTQKIASGDHEQVRAALDDLNKLDEKLAAAKVLSPNDMADQIESLKAELAKTNRSLSASKKPETIEKATTKKAQLEKDIEALSQHLPPGFNTETDVAATPLPDLQALKDLVGVSGTLDAEQLGKVKHQIIKSIADRAKALQDWHKSVSPITGDFVNPDARLLQAYNEDLAGGSTKTPQQFLQDQAAALDDIFKQLKSLPNWQEGRAIARIEELHQQALEKSKAYEAAAKQALACGLQGDLTT